MLLRSDLLDPRSPPGLEIYQLTTEASVPSCHIYMEAQVFTPDSRFFILHRSAASHFNDKHDPEHRFLVCDVETGSLAPLSRETGATALSVSPDGKYAYYFIDETYVGGGTLTLMRRNIDGGEPVVISVIDTALPGTSFRPSSIYLLSTISSDGRRLAVSAFLGDGHSCGAPWGLLIFDLYTGEHHLALYGPSWCNMHPQYSRSLDAERSRDLLVQENHGSVSAADGEIEILVGGLGVDIHVVRDDGQHFRNLPWGRDGVEFSQGHQCWRGRSEFAITATTVAPNGENQLIESSAVPYQDHNGLHAGGIRNRLCRNFVEPHFIHFATDAAGGRLITDYHHGPLDAIYLMQLAGPGEGPPLSTHFLLHPSASWTADVHVHPFLSPDGKIAFFNSDESGQLQAYMIKGLPQ